MASSTIYTLTMAGKPFSTAAIGFLLKNAGVLTTLQISRRLKRTPKAISRKAEKLGLSLAVI